MALSTQTLAYLLKTDRLPQFRGVYPSNWLPRKPVPKPCAIIANTDPHDKPGKHWVAFYIDINGTADYFDSYGYKPIRNEFTTFLDRNSSEWRFNPQRLQGQLSSTCGHYCVYFLMYRCRGVPMNTILQHFDERDLSNNDAAVVDFVNTQFAMTTKVFDVEFLLNQICINE